MPGQQTPVLSSLCSCSPEEAVAVVCAVVSLELNGAGASEIRRRPEGETPMG